MPERQPDVPETVQDIPREIHSVQANIPASLELEAYARELAKEQATVTQPGSQSSRMAARRTSLLNSLDDYQHCINQAVRRFRSSATDEMGLSVSAEWMLDNAYIVRQALRLIHEDLPNNYYSQLPCLLLDGQTGTSRIYALARSIVVYEKINLDPEGLRRFVDAYQTVTPLTMGELWALPLFLRLVIIQSLLPSVTRLTDMPVEKDIPVVDLFTVMTDDEIVAHSIMSLRMLSVQDWKDFFESTSLVEQVLRHDPAGLYEFMDFETRDSYRKTVEEISLYDSFDELQVARQAVSLAQKALDHEKYSSKDKKEDQNLHEVANFSLVSHPSISGNGGSQGSKGISSQPWFEAPLQAHIGYYLLGTGRVSLEQEMNYRPMGRKAIQRWARSHPALLYLGSISLLAILFMSLLINYAWFSGGRLWQLLLVFLLSIVPVLTLSVDVVNWAVTHIVKPRILPKMDFGGSQGDNRRVKNQNLPPGIPEEFTTLVVVPALLTGPGEIKQLLSQLELHYLRNPGPNLCFALLLDLPDAPEQHMPGDENLLEQARAGVIEINRKYSIPGENHFFLFYRDRQWNPKENVWMGWERKRGKLRQLNCLIIDPSKNPFQVTVGDLDLLHTIRYIITLDADTILPKDNANRLVATLAHPLNQAVFRDGTQEVVSGYTILQPRTEINPESANQSLFSQIYSGDTGLDLYTRAVSDVYQDLFGVGIYVGKGIYDIRAFERGLEGVIPENALLSHDLFEGIHGRVGLVTDISLVEDYPANYLVQVHRQARWIRGDWQLLPWLFPALHPRISHPVGYISRRLPLISRWKIFDNLRRSLVAPALMLFFIAGWTLLPGRPWVWTLVGIFSPAVPMFTGQVSSLVQALIGGLSLGAASRRALFSVKDNAIRWLLALVFLPYDALLSTEAIVTTLVRLYITRIHLLRWTTTAQSALHIGDQLTPKMAWLQMVGSLVLVFILDLALFFGKRGTFGLAAPFMVAWLLSPQIAYWINRPIHYRKELLRKEDQVKLRRLARRTWLFFERFVGPDDHWLPPDHYQESPLGVVAHRTSPTNIGLFILSILGAYDIGYMGALDLAARLQSSLESLDRLERYRGHILNWFDTRSLHPLSPRYVSTVDSGNLAACLITMVQGCQEIPQQPILRWEIFQGLQDAIGLLEELLEEILDAGVRQSASPLRESLQKLNRKIDDYKDRPQEWYFFLRELSDPEYQQIDRSLVSLVEKNGTNLGVETLRSIRLYVSRIRSQLDNALRELDLLAPWLSYGLLGIPGRVPDEKSGKQKDEEQNLLQTIQDLFPISLNLIQLDEAARNALEILNQESNIENLSAVISLPKEDQDFHQWVITFAEKIASARLAAKALLVGYQELATHAHELVREMEFNFLFDPERQVFHIGFNVDSGKLDNNYYDLLASESRIASLIAISKGDVPQSHWLHLGRPLTMVDGVRSLLSWSATMFEYLMPRLFVRSYEGTLLHASSQAAVERQIQYGHEKGVPWGISESGYYRFDSNLFYQYRAFGVPGLGFKRGLEEDLVITPYASLLAIPIRPLEVVHNLEALDALQMKGTFGYFESIDFTQARLNLSDRYEVVREYMAHHQGMIFLSLVNYFTVDKMVQRFHDDPRLRSIELLLEEQIPQDSPVEITHNEDNQISRSLQVKLVTIPWRVRVQTPQPRLHFLSNGRYGVMITAAGGGYSTWNDTDLTRWRPDTTRSNHGTWIYVQDMDLGKLYSAGYQPTVVHPNSRDVYFNAHMVELRRRDGEISLSMEITVPPDDDLEVRVITLTNHSDQTRHMRLVSYGEVILSPQASDLRHMAFNKLFIESEYVSENNMLLFQRRPRAESEMPLFLGHLVVTEHGVEPSRVYQSNRLCFLGRGNTPRRPGILLESNPKEDQAMVAYKPVKNNSDGQPMGCASTEKSDSGLIPSAGATLDPVFSLAQEVTLPPHGSVQVAFITMVAETRQEVFDLAGRYQAWHAIRRAFDQSRSRAEVELRRLGLNTAKLADFQRLLSVLIFPSDALRAPASVLASNSKGQPGLWPYAISGDYPILLVKVRHPDELPLVHEILEAHTYWRNRQLKIDLVILNEQGAEYGQELNGLLNRLLERTNSDGWINRRGGIFMLMGDRLPPEDRILLETAARAVLDSNKGLLSEQLVGINRLPSRLPAFNPSLSEDYHPEITPPVERPQDLQFDNGLGGFSPDGREYLVYLKPGQWTPAPWINVIANSEFGFLTSESSMGFSWSENSGENRLTPWNNDPVSDLPAEVIYLRDEETAEFWSPTPLPRRAEAPYLARHGAGYTQYEHNSHGLRQELRLYVSPKDPVKIIRLRLENTWNRVRRITVTYYAEWVLGVTRSFSQQYLIPEFDGETQALLAHNPYGNEFAGRYAFAAASQPLHGLTADRTEFLGRMGILAEPRALMRIGLSGRVEAGLDPCAALQLHVDLQPGASQEVYFLLGEGVNRQEALNLVRKYKEFQQVDEAWQENQNFWESLFGTVQVKSPEKAMDLLLNRWLLYQDLACRVWGRSAFYQSSGAYGFRDQLQDVMALSIALPDQARKQILRAAAHQFEEGDVLHWWHPPSGRGIRTRFSDDMLWLPFVTTHYMEVTGDTSVLDEMVPFLQGPPLQPGEDERYGLYQTTEKTYTIYEHCRRAIEKGATLGLHRLPLIGTGDWNDGFNRVGMEGRGESVWLAWFLIDTLRRFAFFSELRGDKELAEEYRQKAQAYNQAVEESAWDGSWYIRAFYDDGTPLGSSRNIECKIDEIAQSWSVLSRAGDPKRNRQAMKSVSEILVKPEEKLILLFTPPFNKTPRDPGYIKGYLPGIRENGGQYTHASLWTVWAHANLGQGDYAHQLFRLLNPIYHTDTPEKLDRYRVEPYVIAADVYSVAPHIGRGGWTWYTGSAGWMYRLGVEVLLGIQLNGNTFRVDPCIPKSWKGYEMTANLRDGVYHIQVENPEGVERGVGQVFLDGKILPDNNIQLDGGKHEVRVILRDQ